MPDTAIKLTILIVDDEPANIRILVELLKGNYQLRTATNGEKALAIARSDDPPDLILLDILMPGIDGYEVCRRLKADACSSRIPVIFITGKNGEQDEIYGFQVGAVDYVTKPFSPIIIQARVQTHADLIKYRDILERQSYSDGLTGIANRRRYEENLGVTWNFACREGFTLAFIMIDIDEFKKYNDMYGHQAGDDCLRQVAQALNDITRRKIDLLARYGGEEFCCLLPNTDMDGARHMAEMFREAVLALRIPHENSTVGPVVSISQGFSAIQASGLLNPCLLVKAADEALFNAKLAGRNCICQKEVCY